MQSRLILFQVLFWLSSSDSLPLDGKSQGGLMLPNGLRLSLDSPGLLKNGTEKMIVLHGSKMDYWWTVASNSASVAKNTQVIDYDWGEHEWDSVKEMVDTIDLTGEKLSKFIMDLVSRYGIEYSDFHIIAHGILCHVAGSAGRYIHQRTGKRIGRITALEAANSIGDDDYKIRKGDANVVVAIHTTGDIDDRRLTLGMSAPYGDVDVFPNGGYRQPGCPDTGLIPDSCSFDRSYELWSEAVFYKEFLVRRCSSWEAYKNGECDHNKVLNLMRHINEEDFGMYFVETNSDYPYLRNESLDSVTEMNVQSTEKELNDGNEDKTHKTLDVAYSKTKIEGGIQFDRTHKQDEHSHSATISFSKSNHSFSLNSKRNNDDESSPTNSPPNGDEEVKDQNEERSKRAVNLEYSKTKLDGDVKFNTPSDSNELPNSAAITGSFIHHQGSLNSKNAEAQNEGSKRDLNIEYSKSQLQGGINFNKTHGSFPNSPLSWREQKEIRTRRAVNLEYSKTELEGGVNFNRSHDSGKELHSGSISGSLTKTQHQGSWNTNIAEDQNKNERSERALNIEYSKSKLEGGIRFNRTNDVDGKPSLLYSPSDVDEEMRDPEEIRTKRAVNLNFTKVKLKGDVNFKRTNDSGKNVHSGTISGVYSKTQHLASLDKKKEPTNEPLPLVDSPSEDGEGIKDQKGRSAGNMEYTKTKLKGDIKYNRTRDSDKVVHSATITGKVTRTNHTSSSHTKHKTKFQGELQVQSNKHQNSSEEKDFALGLALSLSRHGNGPLDKAKLLESIVHGVKEGIQNVHNNLEKGNGNTNNFDIKKTKYKINVNINGTIGGKGGSESSSSSDSDSSDVTSTMEEITAAPNAHGGEEDGDDPETSSVETESSEPSTEFPVSETEPEASEKLPSSGNESSEPPADPEPETSPEPSSSEIEPSEPSPETPSSEMEPGSSPELPSSETEPQTSEIPSSEIEPETELPETSPEQSGSGNDPETSPELSGSGNEPDTSPEQPGSENEPDTSPEQPGSENEPDTSPELTSSRYETETPQGELDSSTDNSIYYASTEGPMIPDDYSSPDVNVPDVLPSNEESTVSSETGSQEESKNTPNNSDEGESMNGDDNKKDSKSEENTSFQPDVDRWKIEGITSYENQSSEFIDNENNNLESGEKKSTTKDDSTNSIDYSFTPEPVESSTSNHDSSLADTIDGILTLNQTNGGGQIGEDKDQNQKIVNVLGTEKEYMVLMKIPEDLVEHMKLVVERLSNGIYYRKIVFEPNDLKKLTKKRAISSFSKNVQIESGNRQKKTISVLVLRKLSIIVKNLKERIDERKRENVNENEVGEQQKRRIGVRQKILNAQNRVGRSRGLQKPLYKPRH